MPYSIALDTLAETVLICSFQLRELPNSKPRYLFFGSLLAVGYALLIANLHFNV